MTTRVERLGRIRDALNELIEDEEVMTPEHIEQVIADELAEEENERALAEALAEREAPRVETSGYMAEVEAALDEAQAEQAKDEGVPAQFIRATNDTQEHCANCRFSAVRIPQVSELPGYLFCQRYPPERPMPPTEDGTWSIGTQHLTTPEWWCGEWAPVWSGQAFGDDGSGDPS